ncbi:serine hydrolase domain-containing protein [Parasphingorhabdus cellanae]|uniref:Beta-lactamase family protein n=1 Tax=Parasphingorhabdus cellanae TaxID=2806553 RepID=A0ABX7T2E4_9SPHN|nr:serine hydrolase domain-containing protein [Parasphingorhabdus cellanae]QTD55726.1 beta-lactamase family protein [Parasphingorhabdus cellanae]
MTVGNSLFRFVFVFALMALPIHGAEAVSQKRCAAGVPYFGPTPISVTVSDDASSAIKQQTSSTGDLSALFADMYEKSKAVSLTVALANQDGLIWTETQGLEDAEKLHYWASVGKSFTAVVIMQLIEKGDLSLDDTISKWTKNIPNGDLITVRMLLNHTSGLYNTSEDPTVIKNNQHTLSLKDNIKILNARGPLFCPGKRWRYSNTGYLLLGEIAEQVYGQPLQQIFKAQIFDRIGLKSSRMLEIDGDISDVATPRPSDDQKSDIRTPGPAGPIAATSSDMIRFWRAFLNGDLVMKETRDQMLKTLYPMFDKKTYYGLGIMAMEAPGPDGKPAIWIGHAGGMPGIKAFVMIDPVSRQYASVALTGDGPASAIAYNMLRKWQESPAP